MGDSEELDRERFEDWARRSTNYSLERLGHTYRRPVEDATWFAWLSASKETRRIGRLDLTAALEREPPAARTGDGRDCYDLDAIITALRELDVEVSA